jgi:hypothetical protein
MCDVAAMLTIVDTQVPPSLSRETDVFSSWLCFVIRWKQNVHMHSLWWPYSLFHSSLISNKSISNGSTLPSTIMCVWTKFTFWKMSNIRHFNNMYLSHKRVDLAHVFRVYRQKKQIETTAAKNTEKLCPCYHPYHKQEICTVMICSIMSPSRIITWRDFAICSQKSILWPWKGFWVSIYVRKFVTEVS